MLQTFKIMDYKLQIRDFETREELQHYCEGLHLWQIVQINVSLGNYALYFWVGKQ